MTTGKQIGGELWTWAMVPSETLGQALPRKPLSLYPAPVWRASCSAMRCPAALDLACGAPGAPGRDAVSPAGEGSSCAPDTVPDPPALGWLDRAELVTSRSAEVSPASVSPMAP